jgi:tetratricopeptide (TPR) repeat protein
MLVKIDSQATLLQLSGYYKESLEIYNKRVESIRKTNESSDVMDRSIICKADALRISGDYEAAEKEYQTITKSQKMKLISFIHLADLYIQRGE